MRLLLLFTFVFIVILQITCNSNQCGRQSELIDCAGIQGQATFIHVDIYRILFTSCVSRFHLVLGNFNWSSYLSIGSYRYRRDDTCSCDYRSITKVLSNKFARLEIIRLISVCAYVVVVHDRK
jgi:hypothetical protein